MINSRVIPICIAMMLLLLASASVKAQFNKDGIIYRGQQKFLPCMDIGAGYIFDHKYEVFTVSTAFNNVYLRRFGATVMVELNWQSPAVVTGPSVTVFDFAYVWAGIDFVTSRGIFGRGGFTHARKDLGLGVYPFKWATVKICHSFNAGSRFEVGIRIPLRPEPDYLRTRSR